MTRLLLAFIFVLGTSVSAQTPEQFKALAIQRTAELGQCHAELGPLQQLSAQVLAGRLQTIEAFKAQFEAANPGKTLDAALTVIDQVKE